jgi:DNA-binding CsgD family transcriptional regulator
MKLWNWLRRIFRPTGNLAPRPPERYEDTIQIEPQAITQPLRQIAENAQRSPEEIANEILIHGIEKYEHFDEKLTQWRTLSSREQQIAALACLGYTNQDIANRLIISHNTVKSHLRSVQQKFNVRTKEQLRQELTDWDFSAFER